jgi:hypothetical protein
MKVARVQLSVYVNDLTPCVDWYGRLLGRDPDEVPHKHCRQWLLLPGVYLQVLKPEKIATSSSVALVVHDLDAEVHRLSMVGIRNAQLEEYPEFVRTAALEDPEGNMVTLVELL